MGAVAETVRFDVDDVSTNGTIYTDLDKWQSAINDNDTIVIAQGSVIGDTGLKPRGVDVTGSMIVGQTTNTFETSGNLYVMNTAGANSAFTISSIRGLSPCIFFNSALIFSIFCSALGIFP